MHTKLNFFPKNKTKYTKNKRKIEWHGMISRCGKYCHPLPRRSSSPYLLQNSAVALTFPGLYHTMFHFES
jgi:exopolyphosphatase/pppGpp-phosphohydrolase